MGWKMPSMRALRRGMPPLPKRTVAITHVSEGNWDGLKPGKYVMIHVRTLGDFIRRLQNYRIQHFGWTKKGKAVGRMIDTLKGWLP